MHIQEFSVGNFRSFKEINTLNLMATKSVSIHPDVDKNNLFEVTSSTNVKLMRTKAIYGANSSGKSNIIKAVTVFINIVKNSVINKNILDEIEYFRYSSHSEESPSYFQIIFWLDKTRYRYGFEANRESITAEWLYHKPGKREESLFIRENLELLEVNKTSFSECTLLLKLLDIGKGENDLFRANALLITTLSTFGFAKVSNTIVKAISSINVINGLGDYKLISSAESHIRDEKKKAYMLNILKFGDVGIKDIDYFSFSNDDENETSNSKKKKDENFVVFSKRPKFNKDNKPQGEGYLIFSYESEGTKKLFEIAPCIYEAFKNGSPLIIDEFDARFHPLLTKEIIRLFNTVSENNPQLIFTTHDTNLMDNRLFRKDQIDFVEKDSFSSSHLYSLIEFKGIRNDISFEKDYIKGKFGAIPYLGDFTKLFDLIEDAESH
ncbi:ATP-binding protein [uncultured Chryseobacterium sp.]|uniref:AAA family ATPase n=1 Tax=uncultured Chryseobacterium sp. TaxID=259322 RepID=UPI0025E5391F|nr:ATP-binding protein [uncultured Chryseobacterium sp.]